MNDDVTGRRAQGLPAVETVQRYVAASQRLGFTHPDLTVHPGQVLEGYDAEKGLDLVALQHDQQSWVAADRAVAEALASHERQAAMLATVWQGGGAAVAVDFLRRHGDGCRAVAAAVRAAAAALDTLREDLWRAVDRKVATVVEIEGGAAAVREQWSAAATTVLTGAGDRVSADELVEHAVTPFVAQRIAGDWLTAHRCTAEQITSAYRHATEEISAAGPVSFDLPVGFGGPMVSAAGATATESAATGAPTPAATAPAGWSPATAPPASWSSTPAAAVMPGVAGVSAAAPAPVPAPAAPAPPLAPAGPPGAPLDALAAPAAPTAVPGGAAAGGLPDLGSGASGLGRQLVDALGALLGGGSHGLTGLDGSDPVDLGVPGGDGADEDGGEGENIDDDVADAADDDEDADGEDTAGDDEDPDGEDTGGADGEDPGEVTTPPADASSAAPPGDPPPGGPLPAEAALPPESPPDTLPPAGAPPPAEALPPPGAPPAPAVGDGATPCEIAADEVPQVGPPPG